MTRGVIFLITGNSYCVRLMVALCSLRRVYSGPATVLYSDTVDPEFIEKLLEYEVCDVEKVESGGGKGGTQLSKSRVNEMTPYDVTVFLDADVLILRPFVEEMWAHAEEHRGFACTQMHTWSVNEGPPAKRLKAWLASGVGFDHLVKQAQATDLPSVNTGVFAFTKDAAIFGDWYAVSKAGFDKKNFISEETAANLLIAKDQVMPADYNAACKFHEDREFKTARVIHFMGLKHVRINASRGSSHFWCAFFESMRKHDPRFVEIVGRFSQKRERIYLDKGIKGEGYHE